MEFSHLSASTIDAFTVCPRRQYLTMTEDHKARVPNSFLMIGSAAHEALQRYHTEVESDVPLVEMFAEAIKTQGFVPFGAFASAGEFLTKYEKDYPRQQNVLFLEKDFIVPMGKYPVKGFIDRVDYLGDGTYEIIDYKTSWVTKNQWDLEEDIQLITYDVAFRILAETGQVVLPEPIKKVKVSLHYLRYDRVTTEFDDHKREVYVDYVNKIGDMISELEEVPEPRLNNFCRYCDFAHSCELYNSDFAKSFVEFVTQEPEEIAERLEGLRKINKVVYARMDALEDILFKAMEPTGLNHIEVGGYNVDIKTKTYKRWDVDKLANLIPNTFMDYVTISGKKVNQAKGVDLEALDKVMTTHQSKAFVQVTRTKEGAKGNDRAKF